MVADHQATEILNFDLTTRGSLKTRNGYTKLNSSAMAASASPVRGLFRHYQSNGTAQWYAACSGKIYRNDALSATLSGTYTVDADFDFLAYKDHLLGWNENDEPIKHLASGSSAAISAWTPAGASQPVDDAIVWQERIWVVPSNSSWLTRHTSAVGILDGFAAADYLAVGRKDGGSIKKQAVLHGNLVLMKDTGIYVLTGSHPDNYQLDRMSRAGCISKGSVTVGDNGIIYLSHDGVRYFDGVQSVLLSDTADYKIDIVAAMNAGRRSKTVGAYFDMKYLLAYDDVASGSSVNNYMFVYNFMTRSWTKYDIKANVFVKTMGADETKALYCGHSVSGYVYRLFNGTSDDSVAISATYKTKAYNMSNRYQDLAAEDKQFLKFGIEGSLDQKEIEATIRVDEGNRYSGLYNFPAENISASLWDTMIWNGDVWSFESARLDQMEDLPVEAAGKTISIEIAANKLNQVAELDLVTIGYRPKGVRG
jgi:WD40 repeat protein